MKKNIVIIGAGFSGLSAACYLAKHNYKVTVLEKHSTPGGRARQLSTNGFLFDMGPSWYWMPDVFEQFFNNFNKKPSDYYTLERLNPSYKIFFEHNQIEIPASLTELKNIFENIEKGASEKLQKFLNEAQFKYEIGINKLVHKPSLKVAEFLDIDLLKGLLKLDVFTSMKAHVAKYFKNPQLQQILEFPVLFLGQTAKHIPALYSLMNYADIALGTWYAQGGMYSVVKGMHQLAVELGVQFEFNTTVTKIEIEHSIAKAVHTNQKKYLAHAVVASADYNFVEQNLLEPIFRNYTKAYWEKKQFAPSAILYFIGLNKKLKNAVHHQLFFDSNFETHANDIYVNHTMPNEPLFYVSVPSVTDSSVAPLNHENLVILIPIAAGVNGDTNEQRQKYFDLVIERLEKRTNEKIKDNIIFKKDYGIKEFKNDYGAYKGNAYGLANTLMQTALLKPKCINKKVKNLFYTGQLTVPGPGVPPSIISGELIAKLVAKQIK